MSESRSIEIKLQQTSTGKTETIYITQEGKEVDTNPKWTSTGELGCSSSSSSYREKTDIYADGYAFVKYRDTNPDSSSYNDTEWRRASDRDDECVGQVNTTPKWEYIDSSSYGCSTSSSSYDEKTDPYSDGYAFRKQKDTNPDSNTYGDTKWVRYSSWDSKCVGEERPYQPTYTFTANDYDVTGDSQIDITSYKTVEEGGTTHVQWTVDEITGDGADLIEKAVSAGGNTSLTIKVKENSDTSDKKAAITLRQNESGKTIKINVTISGKVVISTPEWEYVDSTSYSCSSSESSYKEKTDPYADGYAFREQEDTNPDSATYGQTRWTRYSAWDSKCKGETLDCTLSVKPSSVSFSIDGSSAGASDINITSRSTISYQVNKACGGPVTVEYDSNLGSKYSGLISISNNEDASMTSGETTVLLTSDSKKIFLDNELSSHAGDVVYTYDDQTVRVPVYVNVTNRPPQVSYIFTTSETYGVLDNVGETKSFTINSVKNLNGQGSFIGYDYTVSDNISDYITIDTRSSSESTEREFIVKYETGLYLSSDLMGSITLTQKESGKKIYMTIKINPVQSVRPDCTVSPSTSEVRFNIPRTDSSGQAMMSQTFTVSLPGVCPADLAVEYNPSVDYGSVSVDFSPTSISSTKKEWIVTVYINDLQGARRRLNSGVGYATLGYISLDVSGGSSVATSGERRVNVTAWII